ncbi:MAG TPA: carboxypeptidase-like regulatory domain-containing protein [Bacteroidia bacterium]|nr:carboxypeptidase-like regulatory domain-containing protein [Bacteroidia bacterium]
MNKKIFKTASIMVALVAFTILLMPSCQKRTDCLAVIHVIDETGNPVAGATVTLFKENITNYNQVTANVSQTQTSDGSGTANFTFPLPTVLDISATTTGKSGKGEISLQVGQTIEQTVRVN